MAITSFDNLYVISYTNISAGTISIPKTTIINDIVDITLIGKSQLEYGEVFDENILHLLENFACLQDPNPPFPDTIQPDINEATIPVLRQPTTGQLWFNKTDGSLYVYDANSTVLWNSLKLRSDIASNSGIIINGQQIPLPVGILTYEECSWFVSPQYIDQNASYQECYTDENAVVTVRYKSSVTGNLIDGVANYIIIGNRATDNHNIPIIITPTPSPPPNTATPTPTITPTTTPAPGSTVTPTPSVTVTPSATRAPTVTPTPTVTRSITPSVTPTVTPSSVNYTIFSLTAGSHQVDPTIQYIGYFAASNYGNSIGVPTFGGLNPALYNGFVISNISAYYQPESDQYIFWAGAESNAPATLFTRIRFTDKDGIFRTFLVVSSSTTVASSGTRLWFWTAPSTLFILGQVYTLLID